jgi:hypothetical protein
MKKTELVNLILDKIKSGENLNFEKIQENISLNTDFSEISGLVNSINAPNAQKRKYYNSIILSKIVVQIVEWFKFDEGKEWIKSQNKSWSNEKIGKNIFGWQKSFFYKLLKMGELSDQIFLAFDKHCDSFPDDKLNRSIENLLRFSRTYKLEKSDDKSILEKELNRFKKNVLYQKRRFISSESIQLVDEIVTIIDSTISNSSKKITENSLTVLNSKISEDEYLSEARKLRFMQYELLSELRELKDLINIKPSR